MVKKLFKHECIYYFRTFSIFLPIVLVIAVMTRVFLLFGDDILSAQIAFGSSATMLVIACMGLLTLPTVIGVVRFYKNMYSAEGYLTFTLPVTNTQHIFVKLVVSVVCQIICALVVVVAGVIALSGKPLNKICEFVAWQFEQLLKAYGWFHVLAFAIELILALILSVASAILLYYACISIGQTAKKNRILMAFVAYIVYYVAMQAISTAFTIVSMILAEMGGFDAIVIWSIEHPVASMHLFNWAMIIVNAGGTALFWWVTQFIMSKKLNLE